MNKNEKGQAVLELALVIPVLILFFMGIYQLGRMAVIQQRCLMSCRQGAWLKAHTNLSHQNIKEQMNRFFSPGQEKVLIEIGRRNPDFPVDVSEELNGILNRFTGNYNVSVSCRIRTLPYFAGVLPYSIPVKANYTMVRGSWAGLGESIKDLFSIE